MATELKLRKGTTAEHSTFTGAEAEVTFDTDKNTIVAHDGATAGGIELSRADGQNANMPTSAMPAGSVIQVVQNVLSSVVVIKSSTYADFGLNASITPSSSNNKILVLVNAVGAAQIASTNSNADVYARITRNGTPVFATETIFDYKQSDSFEQHFYDASQTFLDSPNTTSTLTYKVQGYNERGDGSGEDWVSICRGNSDASITLMEIAG